MAILDRRVPQDQQVLQDLVVLQDKMALMEQLVQLVHKDCKDSQELLDQQEPQVLGVYKVYRGKLVFKVFKVFRDRLVQLDLEGCRVFRV
jgi:hypothetical protein